MALSLGSELSDDGRPDYGAPPGDRMTRGGRAVFFSDFLGDLDALVPVLAHAADQGVRRRERAAGGRQREGPA
jgi:hypothetical protein